MKAKYKAKALQKEIWFVKLDKNTWNKFLSIKVFPTHKMWSKLHNVNPA